MIVFGADEERDGGFVESSGLTVPFFDRVEGGFAGEIEHEEDRYCVVAANAAITQGSRGCK